MQVAVVLASFNKFSWMSFSWSDHCDGLTPKCLLLICWLFVCGTNSRLFSGKHMMKETWKLGERGREGKRAGRERKRGGRKKQLTCPITKIHITTHYADTNKYKDQSIDGHFMHRWHSYVIATHVHVYVTTDGFMRINTCCYAGDSLSVRLTCWGAYNCNTICFLVV